MKKLDENQYYICRLQGKVFQDSLIKSNTSSPVFIRRFMNSDIVLAFDNQTISFSILSRDDILSEIIEQYGESDYGTKKYPEEIMFWIGYFYRVLAFYLNKPSTFIYKTFPINEILAYYNIGHTMDPEKAAQNLIDVKEDIFDFNSRGELLLKKLYLLDNLKKLINKEVKVIVDRPIGFEHGDITYTQNYGYITDYKAADNEFQDAYIIGIDKPIKEFTGKVIAIITRKGNIEDKLVVCETNKNYTKEEIKSYVNFQEKYFNSKIIFN